MGHKIMINIGHGLQANNVWDCGTSWNGFNEAVMMKPITIAAVKYCRQSGITVLSDSDSGNDKNVITGVAWANKQKVELFVSIHCDWYKAPNGVYPLYYPTSKGGKKLATALNNAIKTGMGMSSRGICGRSDLYELSETDMVACVLETSCIKDSTLRNKPDEYGKCIAKGICEYLGVTFIEDAKKEAVSKEGTDVNYLVKVEANKCVIRVKPNKDSQKVRDCPKGLFTIIKENGKWGLLKSGEGWIYLPYTTRFEPEKKSKIEEFCAELIREEPIIMSKMKYSNDDGNCHTFEDALKYKKCNCAKYISYALQEVGLLPKGLTFYWYHTKTLKPAKALAYFKAHPDEWKITYPNRVMKPSELQVGDICGWHSSTSQHTTAICGKDKDGNFIWASGGSSDMKNGMVKVRNNFTNHKINCHIRYIGKN